MRLIYLPQVWCGGKIGKSFFQSVLFLRLTDFFFCPFCLCRQKSKVDLRDLLAVSVEAAVLGGKEVNTLFFTAQ